MNGLQNLATHTITALQGLLSDLSSFWLIVQFIVLLATGTIGAISGAMVRKRVDATSLTMGWPPMLRVLTRTLLDSVGTIVFILLALMAHAIMLSLTWPSQSYLVGVAISLAAATSTGGVSYHSDPPVDAAIIVKRWVDCGTLGGSSR